jgi:molybdopterin/thiamine biosynthesis adenylyltransferase
MSISVSEMSRPRIKPEHRPYRTVRGNVRIGSVIYGIGAEVTDGNGWVWAMVTAMDGTRTADQICAAVAGDRSDLSEADVMQAMDELLAAGFVDDAAATAPPDFSAAERERYSRGVTLFRWMDLTPRANPWEPQERLKDARVLLVGVGGAGGFAAHGLVASGVGNLHCVDPDVIELSNLNRQPLYREPDVGTAKIDVALRQLRSVNSDVVVTGERRELFTEHELGELVAGGSYDLVLLAADRPTEIRSWTNRACLAAKVPWAECGYHGPAVNVGVHVPYEGACWECHHAGEVDRRDLQLGPGQDERVASPRVPWNPANVVTAGLSGILLAHAGIALLTGVPRLDPGFHYGVNLMKLEEPVFARFDRRDDCPACGS